MRIKRICIIFLILLTLSIGVAEAQESGSEEIQKNVMNGKIETLKTDAFSMDYFRFGHGEKTFVILPGLSVQSVMGFVDSVETAYRIFEDDYTVYLFDRRKELPDDYSVYQMAQDTAAAFTALGLENVDLFGASQGGMIAMTIAAEHPELVRKLVLGSTSAYVDSEHLGTINEWIRLAEAGEKTALYLAFGEALYAPEAFEQSRGLLTEAAKTVTDEDLQRFIILAAGLEGFDLRNDLEKIKCPVLVIGSLDDRVLGGDASVQISELLGKQDGNELYMYDGYGHAVYDMAPDYKERIMRFLSAE